MAVIILLPLIVVFLTSFAPSGTTTGLLVKNGWSLDNYRDAWRQSKFLLAFANSSLCPMPHAPCPLFERYYNIGYDLSKRLTTWFLDED